MATRATQSITAAGVIPTYYACTATTGDKVLPGEGTFVHVKNGSGVSTNVVFTTPGTVETLNIEDRTVAVGAGAEKFIAVGDIYRDPTDGLATFVATPATTITFAVLRS